MHITTVHTPSRPPRTTDTRGHSFPGRAPIRVLSAFPSPRDRAWRSSTCRPFAAATSAPPRRARGAALRSGGTMDNQQQKRVFLDFLDQQGYMEEVHGMLGRQVGPVSVRVRGRVGVRVRVAVGRPARAARSAAGRPARRTPQQLQPPCLRTHCRRARTASAPPAPPVALALPLTLALTLAPALASQGGLSLPLALALPLALTLALTRASRRRSGSCST